MAEARQDDLRFALRLASAEELFEPLDARPVARRALREEVLDHLLDGWEAVREHPPAALTLVLPETEREDTDEDAVRTAIHAGLLAASRPLRHAVPPTHRKRLTLVVAVAVCVVCISAATALDQLTNDVVVQGIAQGITLVGWVALWAPVSDLLATVVPHAVNRRRYAEFAGFPVRFTWVRDPAARA